MGLIEGYKSHITLISDSCLEIYPDNTQSDFTNIFPQTLNNRDDKKFSIKLVTIGLSNHVAEDHGIPSGYLKILINAIEDQRDGQQYTKCVGGITFPLKNTIGANYGFHSFTHGPNLPLRFDQLDNLRVTLTDINDRVINFVSGPATILQLEITSGMEEDGQFTLACHSEDPHRFPGNTLSTFTYGLHSTLELEGYEVALLNMIFPAHLELKKDPVWIRLHLSRFEYNLDEFDTVEDFVHKVTWDILRDESIRYEFAFKISGAPRTKGLICIKRKKRFVTKNSGKQQKLMTMEVSPAFAKACGQHTDPVEKRHMRVEDTMFFNGTPNLFRARPHPIAMLQCDLVKTNIMGGTHSTLLQTVPVLTARQDNDIRMYEPKQLTFHPVWKRPFDDIKFNITEPDGQKKRFLPIHPGDGIIVTLLFRLK